jgi:hypothetical protein
VLLRDQVVEDQVLGVQVFRVVGLGTCCPPTLPNQPTNRTIHQRPARSTYLGDEVVLLACHLHELKELLRHGPLPLQRHLPDLDRLLVMCVCVCVWGGGGLSVRMCVCAVVQW